MMTTRKRTLKTRKRPTLISKCPEFDRGCAGHESLDAIEPPPVLLIAMLDDLAELAELLNVTAFDDTNEKQSRLLLNARKHVLLARDLVKEVIDRS